MKPNAETLGLRVNNYVHSEARLVAQINYNMISNVDITPAQSRREINKSAALSRIVAIWRRKRKK
jgi:hypothetical protein